MNPSDKQIFQLRKEGKDVPKELLEKKFAHNRERHSKDMRKIQADMASNYTMQDAFLRDIEEMNRK